jgi:hypothetical protein
LEKVIDVDEELESSKELQLVYWAVYDETTGHIKGIYPNSSADNYTNKIIIDLDLALSIQNGSILLNSCFVDLSADVLEISQIKTLITIDDVLHRVIEKQWCKELNNDIFIDYFRKKNEMTVSMTTKFQGTRVVEDNTVKGRIHWNTDTEMLLLITDYNDPNIVYYMLSLPINDLINQTKTFKNIILDTKFSIYTRRLFKNYVMEIK